MRTCTKCSKPYECYGQRNSFCKSCKRAYDKAYHKNRTTLSKENKRNAQKARHKRIKVQYHEWKGEQGCAHCDEDNPVCLDLHHLIPKEKEISLANAIKKGWCYDRLMEEAKKCVVLCSNCHRKEHERLRALT